MAMQHSTNAAPSLSSSYGGKTLHPKATGALMIISVALSLASACLNPKVVLGFLVVNSSFILLGLYEIKNQFLNPETLPSTSSVDGILVTFTVASLAVYFGTKYSMKTFQSFHLKDTDRRAVSYTHLTLPTILLV